MVEFIEDRSKFEFLADGWNELERGIESPLRGYARFAACAEAFCPPQRPKIIVDREGKRLNAIAPLGVTGTAAPHIEILGSSFVGEPGGFLYSTVEGSSNVLHAVLSLKMPLFLKGLSMFSPEVKFLEDEIRSGTLQAMVREERIPWVSILGKWEDFEKKTSPSRRSSFRRLRRLAEEKGKVFFDVVAPAGEEIDRCLDEAFAVEAGSWKGRNGTAMMSDMKLGILFREFARRASISGKLRLFFYRIDGKAVAMSLCILQANRLWVLKIGHDESWSWCSPGVLLMHEIVRYSFHAGLESCEFLGADESWLHIWANESHSTATYRVYPGVIAGRMSLASDFLRMSVNKVRNVVSERRARRRRTADAEQT